MQVTVYTVFTRNYLAYARTLMASVRLHLPEARRVAILADEAEGLFDPSLEDFEVIGAAAMGIPRFRGLAFANAPTALCCLLKPQGAQFLFRETATDALIYFDADTLCFRRPIELLNALECASGVLTPHRLTPADRGVEPDEFSLMPYGTFNAGMFAFRRGQETTRMLDWWAESLLPPGRCVLPVGYDQAWLNWLVAYGHSVSIIRHKGYNVAVWNLNERPISRAPDGGMVAGGDPLTVYHFSFFDPDSPSRPAGPGRGSVTFQPSEPLAELLRSYADALEANGRTRCARWNCLWSHFRDGHPIQPMQRERFAQRFLQTYDEKADPFDPKEPSFGGSGFLSLRRAADPLPKMVRRIRRVLLGRPRT